MQVKSSLLHKHQLISQDKPKITMILTETEKEPFPHLRNDFKS